MRESPSAILVGSPGTTVPAGFKQGESAPKIAPLPKAAKFVGMSRRQLYAILFSPIHVTPQGIVWKFRGRHMIDLEKLEEFLRRGGTSA